jgi:hypothetical protein
MKIIAKCSPLLVQLCCCFTTHQLCAIVGESALKQLCARHLRGVDTAALYRPTLAEAACTRAAAAAESTAAASAALSSVEASTQHYIMLPYALCCML